MNPGAAGSATGERGIPASRVVRDGRSDVEDRSIAGLKRKGKRDVGVTGILSGGGKNQSAAKLHRGAGARTEGDLGRELRGARRPVAAASGEATKKNDCQGWQ